MDGGRSTTILPGGSGALRFFCLQLEASCLQQSFSTYSCVLELFCLQLELLYLQLELFYLQLKFFAYSGKECLRRTSTDCKQEAQL